MKYSKAATIQKTHHLPTLKFEDQQLTFVCRIAGLS